MDGIVATGSIDQKEVGFAVVGAVANRDEIDPIAVVSITRATLGGEKIAPVFVTAVAAMEKREDIDPV